MVDLLWRSGRSVLPLLMTRWIEHRAGHCWGGRLASDSFQHFTYCLLEEYLRFIRFRRLVHPI